MGVERAERDSLTALLSRRAFEEIFREEAERAAREKGIFALGFVDIDHFKKVNDAYGHGAGDAVIRVVAAAISGCVGPAGYAARYGGEEFAILLPGMEKEKAFLLVERIRDMLEQDGRGSGENAGAAPAGAG